MGRQPDPAWKHCTMINGEYNHVRCNYCGHSMWGGVSRCKEHLAKKRGDVIPCRSCPQQVTTEMMNLLIQQALKNEEKQRQKRESLEKMRHVEVDQEREETACLKRALKESIYTYEMEKKKAEMDDDVYVVACRESLRYYEQEKKCRGEGCSSEANKAGPFQPNFELTDLEIDMEFASDYDSDRGF